MNRDADKTPGEKPEATYETREGSPPKQGTEPRRDRTAAPVHHNITINVSVGDPSRLAALILKEVVREQETRKPESTLEGPYSHMRADARTHMDPAPRPDIRQRYSILVAIAAAIGTEAFVDSNGRVLYSPIWEKLPKIVAGLVTRIRDQESSLEKAEKAKRHAESNAKSEQDLARIYLERAQNAERANEAIAKEAVAATVAPDYKGQLPAAAAAYRRAREWEREYMAIILGRRNGEAPVKAARRVVAERDDLVVQLAERTRQLSSSLEEQEKLRRVHDRAEARVKELEEQLSVVQFARDNYKRYAEKAESDLDGLRRQLAGEEASRSAIIQQRDKLERELTAANLAIESARKTLLTVKP